MVKKFFPHIIIILFAVVAGFSLLHKGLPPTHDGEYHIVRFYEFDKTLRAGQLYPRWQPDLNSGYGSPLLNYYYPLPNYLASFFHFFGMSFIDIFKLEMFLATILGSLFIFLWIRIFWGEIGGMTSSVFYLFSPYRFVDIYVRGSVGEVWALAFFPGFLWCVTKVLKDKNILFIMPAALFLAFTIFSHNILAILFFLFAIFYMSFFVLNSPNKRISLFHCCIILAISLGISGIFWLPAIFERDFARGLQIYDVESNFAEIYQLIFPSWGTGFSAGDLQNQMSFQIGIANLVAVFLSIFVLLFMKNINKRFNKFETNSNYQNLKIQNNSLFHKKLVIFFLIWFFVIFFLMLKVSLPVWKMIPMMNYFQFPWRLLSLEILIVAFLAGSIFGSSFFVKTKKQIIASCLLISFAVSTSIGYAGVAYYHKRDDVYYFKRANFMDGTNTPGNAFNTKWFNANLARKKEKIEIVEGVGLILSQKITPISSVFHLRVQKNAEIVANIAYFPGWTVTVNSRKWDARPNKDGLIYFNLPKGDFIVKLQLEETLIRKFAAILSIASIVFSFILFTKYFHVIIKR